ncbi:MAG: DUF5013 domain-containing protein [Prevotellaceae bacterium]|nr:DUF5013 domain-containing protein [Prevotellaceae bacterium]
MRKLKQLALAAIGALLMASGVQTSAQDVDLSKYPDWRPYDPALQRSRPVKTRADVAKANGATQRPDHLNNALSMFYPPVFNQSGGSCGSAQAIGYIFTHDMNNMRNADAAFEENQYPSHFTWLFTTAGVGKVEMGIGNGVPNVANYGGRTYSNTFGYQDTGNYYFGWMQGYDKWFNAMHNRMSDFFYGTNFSDWLGAREDLKQWLWNHWGEEGYIEGGLAGFGVASGGNWQKIPSTPTNDALGVSNKYYVYRWGKTYDHGLTICGYDDRIEFDLDGNGIAGEEDKDEKGAWIICNSWGNTWCNQGFIYCPYAHSYSMVNESGNHTLPWAIELYHYRHDYRPLRTIKLLMDYDHRWELSLSGGMAQDTARTTAEQTTPFIHFQQVNAFDQNGVSPECPMLGRWADGYHYEPMEFGYDLTDLGEGFDKTKPIKYFFTIKTKSGGIGKGHLYKASILNYEYDKDNPVEIPFNIDTIDIQGGGEAITIAVTVPGEAINAPLNAALNSNTLSWSEPEATTLPRTKYYIYQGGVLIDSVASSKSSYTVNDASAIYSVAAVYKYNAQQLVSKQSNNASAPVILDNSDNKILTLSQQGITIPNAITQKLQQATIEFMFKPNKLSSTSNKMGGANGGFFINASASGQISAGWNANSANDCATTTASQVKANKWSHVAVVVNRNEVTVYVDGMKKKAATSSTNSGVPALGDFVVGLENGLIDGSIDELRIWKSARSLTDIFSGKDVAIANPSAMSDLLVYMPMDIIEENGESKVRDYASGMHGIFSGEASAPESDNTILQGSKIAIAPAINAAQDSAYAGTPVQYTATAPLSCTNWLWNAPGAQSETFTSQSPYIIYNKEGEHTITLTLTNADGTTTELTKDIYIRPAAMPVADFDIAENTKDAGELFSFINRSTGANVHYEWYISGAQQEQVKTTNATAVFDKPGTYTVTLNAINTGGTSVMAKNVTVLAAAPTPAFSINPSNIMLGESTYLVDKSRGTTEQWLWTLDNGKRIIAVNGQNSSLTPKHPGIYDITLATSNEVGSRSVTEKRRLYVSNADAKNALSFAGNQTVTFDCPLQSSVKTWSIDWWMNPQQYTGAGGFATDNDFIHMGGEANGAYKIQINGSSLTTTTGYVILNEWHHYAITYSLGTLRFYRDGELIYSPEGKLTYTTGNWNGSMTISDPQNPYKGLIDEVRIWNKALTASAIKSNCNAPIAEPNDASGLALYYDFNDGQGNVTDRTAYGHDGVRSGFGPDGDAWPLAIGVFTLDLDAAGSESKEVTEQYLKNYERPFIYDENTSVNDYTKDRFFALAQETDDSPWNVVGGTTENDVTTTVHVDKNYNYDFCMGTSYFGFANTVENLRAYQTITLPAGKYRFIGESSTSSGSAKTTYIVATLGDELSDNANIGNALAYSALADNQAIEFTLVEDTEVSLGVLYNMTSYSRQNFQAFRLYRQELEVQDADGETSIYDAIRNGNAEKITPRESGVMIASETKQEFRIYNLNGQCVFNELVHGVHFIPLPAGIYVADGKKIVVK